MPKGTRVHRCVSKLRKKYKYGKAIGICQKSTKQNYMTGKPIRQTKYKKKRRKKKTRKMRGKGAIQSYFAREQPQRDYTWNVAQFNGDYDDFGAAQHILELIMRTDDFRSPEEEEVHRTEHQRSIIDNYHDPDRRLWQTLLRWARSRPIGVEQQLQQQRWPPGGPPGPPGGQVAAPAAGGGKRRKKKKTRKKKGGTGEPNDGLIYARDFVNVAQEPENGWVNWRWDPNNPIPELKVPIGSRYILYTYDNNYEPETDIIELQSQEPYYFGNADGTPSIAINFKIVGEHEGYTFKPEDWNKESEASIPKIGTHQDAWNTDVEWPYAPIVYVIERWTEPPTRISDLPKKPMQKPPKSPHVAGPIEIPKSKIKLPDMSTQTKRVLPAAGGKKTRKKRRKKRTRRRKSLRKKKRKSRRRK